MTQKRRNIDTKNVTKMTEKCSLKKSTDQADQAFDYNISNSLTTMF